MKRFSRKRSFLILMERIICIVGCTSFLSSCAEIGRYYSTPRAHYRNVAPGDLSGQYPVNGTGATVFGDIIRMCRWSTDYPNELLDEPLMYKEVRKIWRLEKKRMRKPATDSRCQEQLLREEERLQLQYEKRISDRLHFLKEFYTDIYSLDNDKFTERYNQVCSRILMRRLIAEAHGRYGDSVSVWPLFTDNVMHPRSDLRFVYLDGNPANVRTGREALYLFGDSMRQRKVVDDDLGKYISLSKRRKCLLDYRFTDAEDKWFMVEMGENHVYVRLDGEEDAVIITGLYNSYRKFYHKLD